MKKWTERFSHPEEKYRPHPFWSWNDELEEDELRRQIRDMAERGMGGFFMHARDGITTEYMGEKWFRMIHACMDEAGKCGLEAWCYDELGWPSGSAGGVVPSLDDAYKDSWIRLREYDGETVGEVLGFYAVKEDNSFRTAEADEVLLEGERLMYVSLHRSADYINVLNPAAVRAFIDVTYERYKTETEGRGKILGFFTDEPQYSLCKTPYSAVVEEEFSRTYGYSIRELLPALFLGRDGSEGVRYDFWRLINKMYTESYAKQIYDWCEENGYLLTGHVMMEDNMLCQIHCTAGCMPSYEYFHIPGIDWLGRALQDDRLTGETGSLVTPLQVGSVAAQLGRKQVISETYAMTGWDVSFAEMKQLAEWQMLGGVNLLCQHLEGYTIRGKRKADFPPSIFYQSPWWSEYGLFSDTVSRLGKLLSEGTDNPGILLLHPMHSMWLKYTNDDLCAEEDFDYEFSKVCQLLSDAHVLYHLGDETIMARHGRVDGDALRVGLCTYHTVVLPSLWGLDRSTYELLLEFKRNGGRLVRMGEIPTFIDGRPAEDELAALYEGCELIDASSAEAGILATDRYFTDAGIKKVRIEGEGARSIRFCRRCFAEDGREAYFFLNLDRKNSYDVKITLDCDGITELHYDTTQITAPACDSSDGRTTMAVSFAPMESHLFVTGAASEEYPVQTSPEYTEEYVSGGPWRIAEGSDANSYTMEYCRVEGTEESTARIHTVKAEGMLNKLRDKGDEVRVVFTFDIEEGTDLDALADVRAVCEIPSSVTLKINGERVSALAGEWWLDRSFSVYEIGSHLRLGENEIELSSFEGVPAGVRAEIGYLYLTGNFGVFSRDAFSDRGGTCVMTENRFCLGNRPRVITGDDIVTEGYPFFAGRMILERDVEICALEGQRLIKADTAGAALSVLHVNGERGKILAWGDTSDDVTDRIRDGVNTVGVELVIGNRNLLGPWHKKEPEKCNATPEHFSPWDVDRWREGYSFLKAGVKGLRLFAEK